MEEGSVAAGRVSSLNSTLQSALQRLAQFELCAALGLLPAASGCRPPAQVEVSQGTALVCNASRQGALRQPTVNGPLEVCSSGGWMVVVPGVSSAVSALASNFTTLSATVSGLARNVSLVSGVVDALTANVSALTPRREAGPRTLAIANYRLYFDTAVAGSCFTNFRLQVAGMAALPAFMAGENIRGSTNRVFVNLGGAAVWSVDAPAGSAVTLEANNVYRDDGRLVNDANGVVCGTFFFILFSPCLLPWVAAGVICCFFVFFFGSCSVNTAGDDFGKCRQRDCQRHNQPVSGLWV